MTCRVASSEKQLPECYSDELMWILELLHLPHQPMRTQSQCA